MAAKFNTSNGVVEVVPATRAGRWNARTKPGNTHLGSIEQRGPGSYVAIPLSGSPRVCGSLERAARILADA